MRFRPESYDAIVRRLVEGRHDDDPERAEPGRPNMLVPYFLMAAYAYEELGDPFLTDGGWDWLCVELDRQWDVVEHHHKYLIDRDALASGTASYLVGDFPTIVKDAAKGLMSEYSRPEEVGITINLLPVPDLSDLLGTVAKFEQDIADLIGIRTATLEGLL
ncbi:MULTISPECIES: hypothetical protein [unclassified Sphingopyxis]|uniref:hypothetical protein n=1 Tax=unclassified Sphingopyxis TaxID=2614943 RepID=UPI0028658466|nr:MULTISPECIES: hypothetical protein [unclassified Sphingopyxis]MDR7062028.1 hypothetical protein [Sphingopyxis sp. BE235]MDR7182486.1 hypothetical protein [Sphingopyxis sp. BE249]